MEICIVNIKNPPKLEKKKVVAERKLPYWIPQSNAHTKATVITLKRRFKIKANAENKEEAKVKVTDLFSQAGLNAIRVEEVN